MRCRIYIVFAIFFSIIVLQGCTTKTVRIDPIPELKTGGPLSGIGPLTFKINEFEDVRPHKKIIGEAYPTHKIELEDQKVPDIVAQAIANELKRNGHRVLQTGASGRADVIIGGVVRGYWVAGRDYATISKVTGSVEIEINVMTSRSKEKSFSKTYRGNYYSEPFFGINLLNMGPVFTDVINQALLDMIKEFTTDEEFLNKIRQS